METTQAKSPSASDGGSCTQPLSHVRNWLLSASSKLMHGVFPPLCIVCKQERPTHAVYFCELCEEKMAPLHPAERCRHCFTMLEEARALCAECLHSPLLNHPRAYVFEAGTPLSLLHRKVGSWEPFSSYWLYQWALLQWPWPDLIAAVPPETPQDTIAPCAKKIAQELQRPFVSPFRIHYIAPFTRAMRLHNKQIPLGSLLLIDQASSVEWLQQAISVLPARRLWLLSLQEKRVPITVAL